MSSPNAKYIDSWTPAPVSGWKFTTESPASAHILPSVLPFQLTPKVACPCWRTHPKVTWIQGGLKTSKKLSHKASRVWTDAQRNQENAETWPQLKMSESKVKKSFRCQGPFPPLHPHPTPLEVNSPQPMVSQAWVLWLRLSWCHSRKKGGHPLHQRKRHLIEAGPPFSSLGSLIFPGHGKQTSS